MDLVVCEELNKTYRQGKVAVEALRGVSLTVQKGGFLALAGPSGSGKTTLLNLIGGLDRPDSGTVMVDGQEVTAMSEAELAGLRLAKLGFVFQSYNLIPVLSALENVEYGMLLQGVPTDKRRARARGMLDEVGLEGLYKRRPRELSGGQQQRVAVARALASGPALVLADEPTANLDSQTGMGLLEMMRRLNQEKAVTFIFSTHDAMVMDFARRVVRLHDGRLVADEVKGD
ncbi:MAG: ABC transporter ATP-binding protein [Deltaproteobacteria bacterium]|nr:ABC transporter ATP-binding protein [Deltaproteobacteria bacterium]